MEPAEPEIMLYWEVMWCSRHILPYYRRWPEGSAVATEKLFESITQLPAIADFTKGDPANLEAALNRFKPICCFAGKRVLDRIYSEVFEGK